MIEKIQIIKDKVKNFPYCKLPKYHFHYILETYASNTSWYGVLLQGTNNGKICMYASWSFKYVETKHPLSHKEILSLKNSELVCLVHECTKTSVLDRSDF